MPWFSRRNRVPTRDERKTLGELRRREREGGYIEEQRLDGAGQIVWHYYLTPYQHDFINDINNPQREYVGKATCLNPPPRVTIFGNVRAEGIPAFHYPAVTPTNQTALVGGRRAREIAQDYIPNTTFSEVP